MIDLATNKQKALYVQWFNRQMNTLTLKHLKPIKDILDEQFEDAAHYFEMGIGEESVDDAVNYTRNDFRKVYE